MTTSSKEHALANLNARIAKMRQDIATLEKAREIVAGGQAQSPRFIPPADGPFADRPEIEAIAMILDCSPEPLGVRQIMDRLVEKGYVCEGIGEPTYKRLYSRMTTKKHVFKKTGPGLWTLVQPISPTPDNEQPQPVDEAFEGL